MKSTDLTREQIEELQRQLAPIQRYLRRLSERMDQKSFQKDDEIRKLVDRAYDTVFELSVKLHYLGCKGGVGKRRD